MSLAGKAKAEGEEQINWINFRRIPEEEEEEEVLLGGFDNQKVMEKKMRKIENSERYKVFEEGKNVYRTEDC